MRGLSFLPNGIFTAVFFSWIIDLTVPSSLFLFTRLCMFTHGWFIVSSILSFRHLYSICRVTDISNATICDVCASIMSVIAMKPILRSFVAREVVDEGNRSQGNPLGKRLPAKQNSTASLKKVKFCSSLNAQPIHPLLIPVISDFLGGTCLLPLFKTLLPFLNLENELWPWVLW